MRSFDGKAIESLNKSIIPLAAELVRIANQISSELDSNGRSLTDIRRTAVNDIIITMALINSKKS